MTLLYALLFISAETNEHLKDAYKRMTTTTSSLTFNTYTASDRANAANSHMLVANKEMWLVDAQLTTNEAKKLVRAIKDIGKPLTTIVITSPHPDRYFGLPIVREAFPQARVVSSASVAKDIAATWPAAVAKARAAYPKDTFAEPGEAPTPVDKLELAGNVVQLLNTDGAESEHAIALYVPAVSALITGNLVTGHVHADLSGKRTQRWLALLDEVRKGRELGAVLTGRGDLGSETLFDEMKAYLKAKGAAPQFRASHVNQ